MAATDCQAVGTYPGQNLAEGWDGASWNVETTELQWIQGDVEVPSAFYSVSCASSSMCVAAGQTWSDGVLGLQGQFPDIASWNGSSWVNQQLLYDTVGTMTGVSCSTTTACTAVGFSPQLPGALIESWNGSKWKAQAPAVPKDGSMTDLKSVSCLSTGTCTAVGTHTTGTGATKVLIETRNAKSWTVQSAPSVNGTLNGVSCTSVSACTAVGSYTSRGVTAALVENWNGTSWTIQPTPTAGPDSLNGVSCTSASACTAVGSDQGDGAMIEAWNGSSWKTQATTLPYGATQLVLNGVSCWSTANGAQCSAVGTYTDTGGIEQTLAVSTSDYLPFIKQQPWNQFANAGGKATFTATGTGYPTPTYQWQISTDDGAAWSPLSDGPQPDGSVVSGAGATTLTISHVQADENGDEYEIVFSNSVGSAASGAASLNVT
jgi:Immunoglobulin I-set domain